MVVSPRSIVLIVEDDEGIAELERQRLEEVGHEIVVASNAEDALRSMSRTPISLILLDFRLPGEIDGLEFYARVKATGADVPVILVTGYGNEATIIKAMRMGVRDFVTKSTEYLDYLPEAVDRILKQVNTEQQLAKSEAQLANVIATAKDAVLVTDNAHRITLFNPAAEQMFGCSASTARGQAVTRFIPPDIAPVNRTCSEQHEGTFSERLRAGTRGVRADGSEFPLESSLSRYEIGGSMFHTIFVRDITERKRSEERLRDQAALLELTHEAINILDMDNRIIFWNRGSEILYGWSSSEALGRNVGQLLFEGAAGVMQEARTTVLDKGDWAGEFTQIAKDGRAVVVASRWTLLRDEWGAPHRVFVISSDVTEKKRLESHLVQAQRMEAIGMLAGGVAHDFNNLLTVINGYSELVLADTSINAESCELIRQINRAGDRAASLTRQLLAFGRKQVLAPQVLNLNELIDVIAKMLRRLIGADIDLTMTLDPNLGLVKADPGQMEQVLMNLAVNARDAMPKGGQLTVETRSVRLDSDYADAHLSIAAGSYVMLAVTDTGTGMDSDTKARIFEPFFTTKEAGKGTGLGLATVHGIIQQSDGHLEVYSELGRGSTFKIYVPEYAGAHGSRIAPLSGLQVPTGTETILLAEDDDSIRTLARIALQSYGYTILNAIDGTEALGIGLASTVPIHLLITDVVMPKMSGRELVEQLQPRHPAMKVLFISGYTDDAIIRHGILENGVSFLHKPFTPTTLARKVREVLDRRGSS